MTWGDITVAVAWIVFAAACLWIGLTGIHVL